MLRSVVILILASQALATDFVPIEVGNRWIYIHENFDGQHIGSYSIDTCVVDITAEAFGTHAGRTYFSSGLMGGPCWAGHNANLRMSPTAHRCSKKASA